MRFALLVVGLLTLSGCAEFQQAPGVIAQPSRDWRAVATESDRVRLREWRSAFVDALRSARAGGHSADVAREGVLLRGSGTERATPYREAGPVQQPEPTGERRSTIRRAADLPVSGGNGGGAFRLGDFYAEELERLGVEARAEGVAGGILDGREGGRELLLGGCQRCAGQTCGGGHWAISW